MTAKPASRAARFQTLCRQAAKRLHTKITDDRVQHYGTLLIAREAITAKLLSGKDIDPSFLLRIDESLRSFMPAAEPATVTVKIVEGITGICPVCKAEIPDYTPPPAPPPSAPSTETKPSTPAPSAAPTVVALSRPARQPITDTMRRFNQLRGYGAAPDGRLGRGNPSRGGAVW